MTWAISSDKPLSQAAAFAIAQQVAEWGADGSGKPIILNDGVVLHNLETGQSYGTRFVVKLSGWAIALGLACGGVAGFLLGLVVHL